MSDTLIGVIVGGFIASVVPIVSLIQQSRLWKKEKKLIHLQQERIRLTNIYSSNFKRLMEEMTKSSYSLDFLSEIIFLLPEDIRREFLLFRSSHENMGDKRKVELLTVLIDAMNKSLSDLDLQIEALLG